MPKKKTNTQAVANRHRFETKEYTAKECESLGLPLYWSKVWLESQLESGQTYAAIQREYGYPANTVSQAAKRHGIEKRPRLVTKTKLAIRKEWIKGSSKKSLAKKYGCSIGTVFNLVEGLEREEA